MVDKRDECGCHRECTLADDILGTPEHECDHPCVWPECLTDDEHLALVNELNDAMADGVILAQFKECPECHYAVLTQVGVPVTGCAQHSGG